MIHRRRNAQTYAWNDRKRRARVVAWSFSRVADLVEGFETPFGLELLSTVHWVAARDGASTCRTK